MNNFLIYLFLFLSAISTVTLNAQVYFNEVIEYEDANLNPLEMIRVSEDTFVVNTLTRIFPTDTTSFRSSSILQYNASTEEVERYDLVAYEPNLSSLLLIEDNYYLYCTNWNADTISVAMLKLNKDFDVLNVFNYSSPAEFLFQSRVFNIGKKIYGTSTVAFDSGLTNDQKTNVKKITTDGEVEWSKIYFEDLKTKGDSDYTVSQDTFIYNSNGIRPNIFNEHTQLVKMDTLGQVIWKFETEEETVLESPSNVVVLSNGEIVLTYSIEANQFGDTKMLWFDPDGNMLKERQLVSPGIDQFGFQNLLEGKGDYFFAHGSYAEDEPDSTFNISYGLITKYDNNGDTIWTRRYRHPDFISQTDEYQIRNLIEEENGDIVCLARIFKWTDDIPIKVWLFKIDENGCIPEQPCGEYINFSSTSDTPIEFKDLKIYPNPARELVHIEIPSVSKAHLEIIDAIGRVMTRRKTIRNREILDIDVSDFPQGTYYVKFFDPKEAVIYRSSFMVLN